MFSPPCRPGNPFDDGQARNVPKAHNDRRAAKLTLENAGYTAESTAGHIMKNRSPNVSR